MACIMCSCTVCSATVTTFNCGLRDAWVTPSAEWDLNVDLHAAMSILSAPGALWHLYVEHLWYYSPHSWVASVASTCRVLAFVVIAPFVLLTLLDATSYVIARTLGVVDDTKASTSETEPGDTPAIVVHADTEAPPEPGAEGVPLTTPPATYFRNPMEEEGNLRLSGVGMFSPAPSQPPSPTLSRRELSQHMHNPPREQQAIDEGGDDTFAAAHRDASTDSSSGESSYAILDQESGSEDAQLTLRRRTRPGADDEHGTAPSDS
ncbi:hypothetical protein AcV7_004368 [Taiwanofungus camphoratus]|nr:hypothetical protein AcV7_004368 [Antrodia cinnamomea]